MSRHGLEGDTLTEERGGESVRNAYIAAIGISPVVLRLECGFEFVDLFTSARPPASFS